MKSSIFSLVFVAGLVAAQSDKIPSCATSCITKYTTGDGIAGCGQLDIKCICSNADFLDGIACCLDDACDDTGKAAAVKYAQQICSSSGVTVPDEVVCKDSASSKSASASASASASSKSASESAASETASEDSSSVSAATTTAEATGSDTASATETVASASTSTDAAAGLSSAGGLLGAIMAMLVAL